MTAAASAAFNCPVGIARSRSFDSRGRRFAASL